MRQRSRQEEKVMKSLNLKPIAWTLGTFAAVIYALCAIFQPAFPNWAMYDARLWQAAFPGFSWTWGGVLLGLVESVLYGLLVAVIFVPLYNYFSRRAVAEEATPAQLTPAEDRL